MFTLFENKPNFTSIFNQPAAKKQDRQGDVDIEK